MFLGLDIGGTKVAAGVVTENGELIGQSRTFTRTQDASDPRQPREALLSSILDAINLALRDSGVSASAIQGLGLASAGPLDAVRGVLIRPSHLPFDEFPLAEEVWKLSENLPDRRTRLPVYFQNDAVAAALGEGWVGKSQGLKTYVQITVGTGIGTGVILNGRAAQNAGFGSEWGHLLVQVPKENSPDPLAGNTVEERASGSGLLGEAARARATLRGAPIQSVGQLAEAARGAGLSTEAELATEIFRRGQEALAALLYALSLGFCPQRIVLSGGLLAIGDLVGGPSIDIYNRWISARHPAFKSDVEISELSDVIGVIGAARLCLTDTPLFS